MSLQLKHHGLVRTRRAIYWLRLYQREDNSLAVVTEVPGNPGPNSMNGLEDFVTYLQDTFGVISSKLTLFQIWPAGYLDSATKLSRVTLSKQPRWSDVDRAVIEALVGPLPSLPNHQELLKLVGEMGGWIRDPIFRDVFEAIPVTSLPPPHNPSDCAHADRFQHILKAMPNTRQNFLARDLEAGRRFLESLQPNDRKACDYHQGNWRAIADESVAIITSLGVQDTSEPYELEANKRLNGRNRNWLWSLFNDPIVIDERGYTNGQHRGCALRFSGAERAAVVVDTEETGEFIYPWTYHGDG